MGAQNRSLQSLNKFYLWVLEHPYAKPVETAHTGPGVFRGILFLPYGFVVILADDLFLMFLILFIFQYLNHILFDPILFILAGKRGSHWKRGSLVVSALAFNARGHGFDPCNRQGKISVSEHAFLSVKCAVLRIGTLTGSPLCRKSHPLCMLKNPTVLYMTTCRLSSCKTGVYSVHLLIILERGYSSMYRQKTRTCIKSRTSSNFGQIGPLTTELAALEV